MLRLTTRKILIVPHSLAIISAIILIWSTQAENASVDVSRLSEPQQMVKAESCDQDKQKATIVSIAKAVPSSPWAVLHLF
jgi:hypothetical protein